MGKYEKNEFLIDVDVEFYKIKKLLEKDPRTLRDDPIISIDYHRIIDLIRQKKLLEQTSNIYDPEGSYRIDWKDPNMAIKHSKLLKKKQLEQFLKRDMLEAGGIEQGGEQD